MLSVLSQTLRPIRYVLILLSLLWLSACELDVGGGGGPFVNTSAPVPVALLIPFGSGESTNDDSGHQPAKRSTTGRHRSG